MESNSRRRTARSNSPRALAEQSMPAPRCEQVVPERAAATEAGRQIRIARSNPLDREEKPHLVVPRFPHHLGGQFEPPGMALIGKRLPQLAHGHVLVPEEPRTGLGIIEVRAEGA